jgi:putative SbcD/Mre11-related phosphoesterase
MPAVVIAPNVLLDSRLALFHTEQSWMAIADLHFGYEVSQRARGWLIPFWGMEAIADRLRELVADYQPQTLLLVGDIVHCSLAERAAVRFVDELRLLGPEIVLLRGNHDRHLQRFELADEHRIEGYRFHHGHCRLGPLTDVVDVIGHFHPCWKFNDAAGLRLRVPALVETGRTLILPAFSPWAAGTAVHLEEPHRMWVCSKNRVFPIPVNRSP